MLGKELEELCDLSNSLIMHKLICKVFIKAKKKFHIASAMSVTKINFVIRKPNHKPGLNELINLTL